MTNAQRIDRAIALFSDLKSEIESRERLIQKLRSDLVTLARSHGFRRRGAWLLQGERNQALLTRDLDVFVEDQARAAQLPRWMRDRYLVLVYKPADELKLMVKNGQRPTRKQLRRFIDKALKLRRHWRVAWLHLDRGLRSTRHARPGSGRERAGGAR